MSMGLTHFTLEAGAVSLALTALGAIGMGIYRLTRRIIHLNDDILGEEARPGQAARPGVIERTALNEVKIDAIDRGQVHIIGQVNVLKAEVQEIKAQLNPNHGASMYDMLKRVDDHLSGGKK